MAKISQIKGVLLEEAILYLLSDSGYVTVENIANINAVDTYLENAGAGLCVLGRGEKHQIDAIADYLFTPPFTNPMRLLCEAKYHQTAKVGIEVIRNAVGVRKDAEEYFRPSATGASPYRHHYQYAVFASTEFTENAQNYAYAQDIYLFEMSKTVLTQDLLTIIDFHVEQIIAPYKTRGRKVLWNTEIQIDLSVLRQEFREHIEDAR